MNDRVWGIPAVLSRKIPGNALRAFPGSFRNSSGISSGKSQPYWGYGPAEWERQKEVEAAAAENAPITPAVLQSPALNPRVLPPRNLPFVHFDPRVFAEQRAQLEAQEEWEQREEEVPAEEAQEWQEELQAESLQEQTEAREWMEETSQLREVELREAREQIRQLEEAHAAGSFYQQLCHIQLVRLFQPAVNTVPLSARGPRRTHQ